MAQAQMTRTRIDFPLPIGMLFLPGIEHHGDWLQFSAERTRQYYEDIEELQTRFAKDMESLHCAFNEDLAKG